MPRGRTRSWGAGPPRIRPVAASRAVGRRWAVRELRGPAGDRRRVLIDHGGKVVTRRRQPRLAKAAAEQPLGGGLRASAHRSPGGHRAGRRPSRGRDVTRELRTAARSLGWRERFVRVPGRR
ncbi:MOSC N-terminal beta barrel domain-containing protein [Streptomyces sp. NPDC004684]